MVNTKLTNRVGYGSPFTIDTGGVMSETNEWIEPRVPEEAIRQLALDIVMNKVFTSWHVREHDWNIMNMVFMPIMFLSDEQVKEYKAHPPSFIYARYRNRIGNQAINGYPMFNSMGFLYKTDTELLRKRVRIVEETIKELNERPL